MTAEEFSNEWDLYWNNISSDQAPGLNEYEKSVFLTRALNDLIQAYFNPKKNKVMEGFEGSAKRNMDFSKLILSYITKYEPTEDDSFNYDARGLLITLPSDTFLTVNELLYIGKRTVSTDTSADTTSSYTSDIAKILDQANEAANNNDTDTLLKLYKKAITLLTNQNFKNKNNAVVLRQIIRVSYLEYLRLMTKAYKEPLRTQCWALTTLGVDDEDSDSGTSLRLEVIPRSLDSMAIKGDDSSKDAYYVLRYIRKPRPIILTDLSTYYDNVSIDGYDGTEDEYHMDEDGIINSPCELDSSIHKEILLRAIELAKAVYVGDFLNTVLGSSISGTEIGMATSGSSGLSKLLL